MKSQPKYRRNIVIATTIVSAVLITGLMFPKHASAQSLTTDLDSSSSTFSFDNYDSNSDGSDSDYYGTLNGQNYNTEEEYAAAFLLLFGTVYVAGNDSGSGGGGGGSNPNTVGPAPEINTVGAFGLMLAAGAGLMLYRKSRSASSIA